jgi:hypothetical protein
MVRACTLLRTSNVRSARAVSSIRDQAWEHSFGLVMGQHGGLPQGVRNTTGGTGSSVRQKGLYCIAPAHPTSPSTGPWTNLRVAFVNNIPTLASRLNGLSIANVASSHSYDLNSRRCAVRRSPAWPAGGARRSTRAPRTLRWPPPSATNCPERYPARAVI